MRQVAIGALVTLVGTVDYVGNSSMDITVEVYADPGNGATPTRTSPTLHWVHAMRQQMLSFQIPCRLAG